MVIMSFKSKKDANKLLEKAHEAEEHVARLVDCLEEAVEEMEEKYGEVEEGHRYEDYDRNRRPSRFDYMRRMR